MAARLLVGGRSNLSYQLSDAADHRWVLRRPPLAGVVPSVHDVVREFCVVSVPLNAPGLLRSKVAVVTAAAVDQ